MRFKQIINVISLFTFFSLSSQTLAGIIYFTDRTEFENAIAGGLSYEGFEGGFSTSVDVSGYKRFYGNSSLVSEGEYGLGVKESNTVTFNFSHEVFAIGFDVNELNSSSLSYFDSAGHSYIDALLATEQWDASSFFGILSDTALSSFSLAGDGNSSTAIYGIDALVFTLEPTEIPSPSTISLFLLSLIGLRLIQKKII